MFASIFETETMARAHTYFHKRQIHECSKKSSAIAYKLNSRLKLPNDFPYSLIHLYNNKQSLIIV